MNDVALQLGKKIESIRVTLPVQARVLVVEDSAETACLLVDALCRDEAAFEATVVASVSAGLERIGRERVDCVLLDYRLPDGNGLDCLRQIRRESPDLPVVMVTAAGSVDVAVEAMKAGAADYVVKHGTYLARAVDAVRQAIASPPITAAAKQASGVGYETAKTGEASERPRGTGSDVDPQVSVLDETSPEGPRENEVVSTFRCTGGYWTIVHEGERNLLPDAKGLRLLAILLRDPGREFYSRQLLDMIEGIDPDLIGNKLNATEQPRAMRPEGCLGPLLDTRAKREYRDEVVSLKEQIDEAVTFNDAERANRLRERLRFLAEQLAAAVGLGGRDRPVADPDERARQKARKNIKAAIEAIRKVDPSLGYHLDRHVKTGRFCSYIQSLRRPVRWAT